MSAMNSFDAMLTVTQDKSGTFHAPNGRGGWATIFGGQLVAQALAAAYATVGEDRQVNSLHCYFLRGGAFETPFEMTVANEREGGSLSLRRVAMSQGGKPVLSLLASFHTGDLGPVRDEATMPQVDPPEAYTPSEDLPGEGIKLGEGPLPFDLLEVRPVKGCRMAGGREPEPPHGMMWIRARDTRDLGAVRRREILAYASDLLMIGTALAPHRAEASRIGVITSLDHALHFHSDYAPDEWLLVDQYSDWAADGRTYMRSTFYAQDGRRVASVVQEGMIRFKAA